MQRKCLAAREQNRRDKALAELNRLAATIQARNQGLTAVAAAELADRFTREIIEELIADGKIKYDQR